MASPYDGDPEYEAERKQMLEDMNRLRNDVVNVMKTDSGKRLLIHILEFTGYKQTPFDKHNSEMSRNVGRGDVGRFIENLALEHAPEHWLQILTDGVNLFASDRSLINVGDHHDD